MGQLAEAAFRNHREQLYRYVRRRTTTNEDAEDITQAVFVEAAARLQNFRPGTTPVLAWLYTVAQRALIDDEFTFRDATGRQVWQTAKGESKADAKAERAETLARMHKRPADRTHQPHRLRGRARLA